MDLHLQDSCDPTQHLHHGEVVMYQVNGSNIKLDSDCNIKHKKPLIDSSRTPLRSIPTPPPPPLTTKPMTTTTHTAMAGTTSGPVSIHQDWPSSSKPVTCALTDSTATQTTDSHPVVESFELEDTATGSGGSGGSGGTSWTLRMPWLRNKRHRRLRQDDENSSIQTSQSRWHNKPGMATNNNIHRGDEPENDSVYYYGGLMKTGSPSSVLEAKNIVGAMDGAYQYPTQQAQTQTHVLQVSRHQQQPQIQSQAKKKKASKQKRIRKKSNKKSHRQSASLDQNLLLVEDGAAPPHPINPLHTVSTTRHLQPKNNNKVFRNRSWISTSSQESGNGRGRRSRRRVDDDSLADFDDNEWTPQDSAYGAAIPVCGWVPKRLRQGIEATLIALTVFALVYLVVTTSISVQESKESGKHTTYNDSYVHSGFDDDWYVEYSQFQNDEDDYFSNNNNNNNNMGENGGDKGNGNNNNNNGG